jgi:hypothetical protein
MISAKTLLRRNSSDYNFFFGFLVVEQISWFGLLLAPCCFKKAKLVANMSGVSLLFHLLPVVLVM